ncbi:MAG: hypothetical protein PHY14_00770 [Candidatus Gracilibacteria bacterium]|nr:hypothetical protein [Candidatus Gracilibacteria bacterium]
MGIKTNEDGMYVDPSNPNILLGGAYLLPGGNYCDRKTYERYLEINQKYLSPVALAVKKAMSNRKPKTFH